MKCEEMAIVREISVSGEYFQMEIVAPRIAAVALPGQFVNVRVAETLEPLLRRPISISDVDGDVVRLLVQVRGKGTALLSQKRAGDVISVIGPLGKGFPTVSGRLLFVAGGVGVAPFAYLGRVYPGTPLLLGVRSREVLPPLNWFDGSCVTVATDDGSVGKRGTVLDLVRGMDVGGCVVFACGPHRMLAALATYLEREQPKMEAYFSTESMMACGFGACRGCVLHRRDDTYALCCTDGPVFHWREMLWER